MGLKAASRNQLLARLHCIKTEQGWDDDTYRDILHARTGKRSAADLDGGALARLVAKLGEQKPKGVGKRADEWSWIATAPANNQARLRYIIVLAGRLGIERGKQVRYVEGIAENMDELVRVVKDDGRREGRVVNVVKPLPMCTAAELAHIINALEKAVGRKAKRDANGP